MAPDDQIEILRGPLAGGAPPSALAVYGRWWQLETYLREVAYTEMRAAFGTSWAEHVGKAAATRAERDQINAYMASADADEPLAYADASVLFALIKSKWELFEPVLLPQVRWAGLVDELLSIRNRGAHCRRPHRDDLARLEQSLRNLEPGAQEFYRSYTQAQRLRPDEEDPVVDAWLGKSHPSAQRLVDHCQEQYDVSFRLSISTRPWGPSITEVQSITGTAGVFWHADWILGSEEIRPSGLWKELRTRGCASSSSTCSSTAVPSPRPSQLLTTQPRWQTRSATSSTRSSSQAGGSSPSIHRNRRKTGSTSCAQTRKRCLRRCNPVVPWRSSTPTARRRSRSSPRKCPSACAYSAQLDISTRATIRTVWRSSYMRVMAGSEMIEDADRVEEANTA